MPEKRDSTPGLASVQPPSSAQKLADAAQEHRADPRESKSQARLQVEPQSPFLLHDDFTNERSAFSAFSNDTGHASTLLPSMKMSSLPSSLSMASLSPGRPGAAHPNVTSTPLRSNSMSVLEDHDTSLPQSSPLGLSATVNSLTDPAPLYDGAVDASSRPGLSAGQMPWAFQQDFMDAFLNNPTTDTVLVGPGSPPCLSPTALSFSPQENTSRPSYDISLMSAL